MSPDLPAPELASQLRPALLRLSRKLRQQADGHGVPMSQLSALGTVYKHGPMSPSELAAAERVQPPSMTKVVVALEEQGLLSRSAHPTDGRQAILAATPAGRKLIESVRRTRDAWLSNRLDVLTATERAVIGDAIPILEKLIDL